jgi:hypothetical protein
LKLTPHVVASDYWKNASMETELFDDRIIISHSQQPAFQDAVGT